MARLVNKNQISLKLLYLLYDSMREIDYHIRMLRESLWGSTLWFSSKVRPWIISYHRCCDESLDKLLADDCLRGHSTPNQHLAWFACYFKIYFFFFFLKNIINILKQAVWETQKWRQNFGTNKASSSWVFLINILHVLISNSRTFYPTEIIMSIFNWVSQTICFKIRMLVFKRKCF